MIVSKRLLQQLIDEEVDRALAALSRIDEGADLDDDQDDDDAPVGSLS